MQRFIVGIHKEVVNIHRSEIIVEAESEDAAKKKAEEMIHQLHGNAAILEKFRKKFTVESEAGEIGAVVLDDLEFTAGEDTIYDDGVWVEDVEVIP